MGLPESGGLYATQLRFLDVIELGEVGDALCTTIRGKRMPNFVVVVSNFTPDSPVLSVEARRRSAVVGVVEALLFPFSMSVFAAFSPSSGPVEVAVLVPKEFKPGAPSVSGKLLFT